MNEPLIFELSSEGRTGFSLPDTDVPARPLDDLIPEKWRRRDPARLPQISELDVVRHFVHLSVKNHHLDKGFYPLGSCTMKYNPKVNETVAGLDGFAGLHPFQPESGTTGALRLMGELADFLARISGLDAVSLQPAAGAQGEMTGLKVVRAYHESLGNPRRTIVLPDSAHGTNPASAAVTGYSCVQVRSDERGLVDMEDLDRHLDGETAAFMLTNPNTLGLFEKQIRRISELVHSRGALLYMDGANLNALLGIVRPGDIGFDVIHFNLHKTFSSPHGGGGPGSGPVGVRSPLAPFLPRPMIRRSLRGGYEWEGKSNEAASIGKMNAFFGHFAVMVRAYAYIRMLGGRGLRDVSENAILNANYLMRRLENSFDLPHPGPHMHEFVLSGDRQKERGVRTLDIAKRLLDHGVHAPTVYFPQIVHEAMMIEPTETESKETLDAFVEIMESILREIAENPESLHEAPRTTPVSRLDEGAAARQLDIRFRPD
jgi:glycine dehydrogenase subunit 2